MNVVEGGVERLSKRRLFMRCEGEERSSVDVLGLLRLALCPRMALVRSSGERPSIFVTCEVFKIEVWMM